MQKRLADGCRLTRDPVALIETAGFEIIETSSLYGRRPKPWTYFTEVQARKPERLPASKESSRCRQQPAEPVGVTLLEGTDSLALCLRSSLRRPKSVDQRTSRS